MSHFIIEFKHALAADYCDFLMHKFNGDPRKIAGRTGAGVDKSKKDSEDLTISLFNDWQQECQNINNLVWQGVAQYAKVYPFLLTGAVSPSFQDAKTGQVRTLNFDDIGKMADADIETLARTIYQLDNINLQKYQKSVGGYHHWHSEHYPHPQDPAQRSLHRVLLWLLYLNDVEQGGETEFFYQQSKVKASKGSLVLAPCYFTHSHRGCVPVSNDKYVLASWVSYKNASDLYPKN